MLHRSPPPSTGRLLVAVLVVALLLPVLPAAAAPADAGAPAVRDTRGLIVTTAAPAVVRAAVPVGTATTLADGVLRVTVPAEAVSATSAALTRLPGVAAVEAERTLSYTATRTPNDPDFPRQWAHTLADAPSGWALRSGATSGPGPLLAIVDSGVDATHPDLAGRVAVQEVVTVDAEGRVGVGPGVPDNDACGIGHGTLVAGVAAAEGDNGRDIAGVVWNARVADIALSSPGSCAPTDAKVIAALGRLASDDFRAAHGRADVVNLSLSGREPSGRCPAGLQTAIDRVVAQGTVVVAASGNEGTLGVGVPSVCRGVIAVGGSGPDGMRARYSARGRYLDLVAPGGDDGGRRCEAETCILTTRRGGGTAVTQGTSFSAPYVSGLVALLRAERADLTPAHIESVLERTARHPGGAGAHDDALGWGVVQVGAALQHVRDGAPIPAPRRHPAVRVAGGGPTTPVAQAVAVSRAAFISGGARHAVIARDDDFADALAGSTLGGGRGPLLFAGSRGPLPAATRDELRRAVRGGATVYLLGGGAALDPGLDEELRQLGYVPARLSGRAREETAVAVAREVDRTAPRSDAVVVATRRNWPDAVAAGSLGAGIGMPILLTDRDGLHPATAAYLAERRRAGTVGSLYVVGGDAVVSDAAASAAAGAAGLPARRLAGPARDATATAVATEQRALLGRRGAVPGLAVAIDLDRADGYAHALSASVLAGTTSAVFVPVRGAGSPERLTAHTRQRFCGLGLDGALAGGADLLPDSLGSELVALLAGDPSRC